MELWIRSQDKKDLICTRRIYVHENTIRTNVYEAIGFAILGEYETKERALEVLDEIQRKIEDLYALENCSLQKNSCIEQGLVMHDLNIYKMPEK